MNHKWLYKFCTIFCLACSIQQLSAQNLEKVEIGVLLDGDQNRAALGIEQLRDELTALLSAKYDIQIPPGRILDANWSVDSAKVNYRRLVEDENVDIIFSFGILTGSVVATQGSYSKPVIVLGIIDPVLHGIPPTAKNTSGIHNLNYLLTLHSIPKELQIFHSIFPYKKLGIIFYGELFNVLPIDAGLLRGQMQDVDAEYIVLPMDNGFDDAFEKRLEEVDAVYVGYLGKSEGEEKDALIATVNARGIPSFGLNVADVKRGVLAATAPEDNLPKIFRRLALNVEAILNGEDPADFPVYVSFDENLTINMKTARQISFSPKFEILSQAHLLHEYEVEGVRTLNLADVMQEALNANLDLIIEAGTVASARKDVQLARARLFPSLSLRATGLQIDRKRAKNSFGQQAERTLSGTASVEQLIFSEQALGNVSIQKHLLRSTEYGFDQIRLDVILESAKAYFNILQAKTFRKIQQDNVDLIKENLAIAKQREAIGYSGRSDVFRWESELARVTTDLLAAKNNVELAKIQLNRTLNKSLGEDFIVQDAALTDSIFHSYTERNLQTYIDNPRSLDIFTNFLLEEAKRNSPELIQIDASIAALNRSATSIKRQRFMPTIVLGADTQRIFSRSGSGSEVSGIHPLDSQWNVAVNFSLPLFQGGEIRLNAQQTEVEIQKLRDQETQLLQFIKQRVRAALLNTVVTAVNLQSSKRAAEFAGKSLTLVQDGYSQGTVSIVDLRDAQNAALNADEAAVNSVYEHFINILELERALGSFALLHTAEEEKAFLERFKTYFAQHSNR